MRFRISEHAIQRFLERHESADELTEDQARHILLAELDHSTSFGAQVGGDQLFLLPCEMVAAVRPDGDTLEVKTILPKSLAIANMQAQGIKFVPTISPAPEMAVQPEVPNEALIAKESLLRSLATGHFKRGTGKKARNTALREHGFDPAGPDGDAYRAFFQQARLELYAELRRTHRERIAAKIPPEPQTRGS